jgi:hypothetical protein
MAIAASYNPSLQYGAQTPFSDQLSFAWEGGMWEYDAQHNSLITAGNGGTKPTQAGLTIFYNQGTQRYDLEQTLQPDEQMWIDVGKLIREHVPDKYGKVLPADLSSGSYEFRDLTDSLDGTLFEGKVVYEKTYGHVTYGCSQCCSIDSPYIEFNPLDIGFGLTAPNSVWGTNNCTGTLVDLGPRFYYDWSTANTALATVDSYGTHTGAAVGSTTSTTFAYLPTPIGLKCLNEKQTVSGTDNIVPRILLGGSNGTDVTGQSQPAVVGQQIVLYASYALPPGITVASQSWSPPGIIVGGFNTGSTNGGSYSATLNQQQTTFYWVTPIINQPTTFTLNLSDGKVKTVSTTFNISGPSAPGIATAIDQLRIIGNNLMRFGQTGGNGITFTASSTPPAGYSWSYVWYQLRTADSDHAVFNGGSLSCTTGASAAQPHLDGSAPYSAGAQAYDSPNIALPSGDSQLSRTFSAKMYLLWSSGLANSIPVPLGYVTWSASGTATFNSSTGLWTVTSGNPVPAPSAFAATVSYPSWTVTDANGPYPTCN